MSTKQAQRAAHEAWRKRLKESGGARFAVAFSPGGLQALDALTGGDNRKRSQAVNAALIEAARRLGDADDDRELPPLTNAELKAIVAAIPVGRPIAPVSKPKATRQAGKGEKAVSEAPARAAGPSKVVGFDAATGEPIYAADLAKKGTRK